MLYLRMTFMGPAPGSEILKVIGDFMIEKFSMFHLWLAISLPFENNEMEPLLQERGKLWDNIGPSHL